MKAKAVKERELASLRGEFETSPTIVICKFEGLNVADTETLRNEIRRKGGRYRVASNRLARLAAKDTPFEAPLADQRGMTALAFAGEDPIDLLKTLVDYAKEHEVFSFACGVVEGRVLDIDALNELSKLPGREGVYAKLLFLLNAPAQRLMSVIQAPARDLSIVVNQGVQEGKFAAWSGG